MADLKAQVWEPWSMMAAAESRRYSTMGVEVGSPSGGVVEAWLGNYR